MPYGDEAVRLIQIEQEDLGRNLGHERDGLLVLQTRRIPGAQEVLVEGDPPLDDVEPSSPPWIQLMDQMMADQQDLGVHLDILMDTERSAPPVRRGDESQNPLSVRDRESFLLSPGQKLVAVGRDTALKYARGVE